MAGMVPAIGGKTVVVQQIRMSTAIAYGVQATRKPPKRAQNDHGTGLPCSPSKVLTDDENNGVSNTTLDDKLSSRMSFVEIRIRSTSTFVNLERIGSFVASACLVRHGLTMINTRIFVMSIMVTGMR